MYFMDTRYHSGPTEYASLLDWYTGTSVSEKLAASIFSEDEDV
jgi:hypothetical protein